MPLTDADREAIKGCQPKPVDRSVFNTRNVNAYRNGLISESFGCSPSQVAEFNQHLERHGIKESRFLPDGRTYFASRRERKQILKLWGRHDRDGGYSD